MAFAVIDMDVLGRVLAEQVGEDAAPRVLAAYAEATGGVDADDGGLSLWIRFQHAELENGDVRDLVVSGLLLDAADKVRDGDRSGVLRDGNGREVGGFRMVEPEPVDEDNDNEGQE